MRDHLDRLVQLNMPRLFGPQSTERNEDVKSKKVTLADLTAKGTSLYAQKKYEAAVDVLSQASELQVEINGETSASNAEVLFHYGRSLEALVCSRGENAREHIFIGGAN